MAILPGFDDIKPYLSVTQFRVYVSVHWLLILFYGVLIVITVANIWQILVKQKRWKQLPMLFFYIFVFIGVVLRELCNIMELSGLLGWQSLILIQPVAKQGVGIL